LSTAGGLPPEIVIAEGELLHRVHGRARIARWYGRRDATWRWDDPEKHFGVLYLGRSLVAAFSETLLRAPWDRDVLWSHVLQKRRALFKVIEPLRLAKLHGEGLAWWQVTATDIDGPDYGRPQSISGRVNALLPVDGIQYRSRFDNDELCVALYDRADDKVELVSEGASLDRAWTVDVLTGHGYRLIEP
jgi:hypothetical protein